MPVPILFLLLGCGASTYFQQMQERSEARKLLKSVVITAPPFVHPGYPLTVDVSGPPELTIVVPDLPTDTPGHFSETFDVHYKRVTVQRDFAYHVASTESSPWLPVEEDNRWRFNRVVTTTKSAGRLLLIVPLSSTRKNTYRNVVELKIGEKKAKTLAI